MHIHAKKHYPKEYGGLLVGRYLDSNKMVLVEEIVLPTKFKSSTISFERGVDGLKRVLTTFFKRSPSLIYVGEWHTHPNGSPAPSTTDISALHTIAQHHEVFIENPILLIIGGDPDNFQLGFYVLYKNQIYHYEEDLAEVSR